MIGVGDTTMSAADHHQRGRQGDDRADPAHHPDHRGRPGAGRAGHLRQPATATCRSRCAPTSPKATDNPGVTARDIMPEVFGGAPMTTVVEQDPVLAEVFRTAIGAAVDGRGRPRPDRGPPAQPPDELVVVLGPSVGNEEAAAFAGRNRIAAAGARRDPGPRRPSTTAVLADALRSGMSEVVETERRRRRCGRRYAAPTRSPAPWPRASTSTAAVGTDGLPGHRLLHQGWGGQEPRGDQHRAPRWRTRATGSASWTSTSTAGTWRSCCS